MRRRTSLRRVTAVVGAAALAVPVGYLAIGPASAATPRHVVTGTHPSWAVAARQVGTPAASRVFTVDVALQMRDQAGALALLKGVSTPGSADYHHYLTTSEFNARFAPTGAAVSAVSSYLHSQGMTLHPVPSNHRYVEATGTTAQIEHAFGATLHFYSVDGITKAAPSTAMTVPATLAPSVLAITGIGDMLMHTNTARPATGSTAPNMKVPPVSSCSSYFGQHTQTVPKAYGKTVFPTYICGYQASQLQQTYGVKHAIATGHDGTGTKVAILDAYASPTILADANQLFANVGLPAFGAQQFSQQKFRPFNRKAACGGAPGWWGEQTLDVEALHTMAPGARELYVGAQNCGGGFNHALNWIVSNVDNSASKAYGVSMISDSWAGTGEQGTAAYYAATNAIFVQAGLEGVGVYFSSGDYGDESTIGHTTQPEPDFPASSPYVTAVGGDTLAVNEHNGFQWQTGWGTYLDEVNKTGTHEDGYQDPLPGSFEFGSGGGTSTVFKQPWYQRGTVPDKLARSYDGQRDRVVPDISMDGDPYTGFLEGITQDGAYTQYPIGGTSLACPLTVGTQATVQGRGTHIGFADPVLYSLSSAAYRDVLPTAHPEGITNTSGSYLTTIDSDSTLNATVGYDNVTGIGSPNGAGFLAEEWAAVNHH